MPRSAKRKNPKSSEKDRPVPAKVQKLVVSPPISEPWTEPAGPFQRILGFSFLHSGASEMSSPNELKSLPWLEWQQ